MTALFDFHKFSKLYKHMKWQSSKTQTKVTVELDTFMHSIQEKNLHKKHSNPQKENELNTTTLRRKTSKSSKTQQHSEVQQEKQEKLGPSIATGYI